MWKWRAESRRSSSRKIWRHVRTSHAQVESIYRWKGKIESATEALVVFKLTANRYAAFEKALRALHPYKVPEIIALPVTHGSNEYLRWVCENCAE